jgi:hypothetical protein
VESSRKPSSRREQAAALIIVLALVVLVTGLVVAYFSRATSDRPVAHSSFNQSKADQLAQSAMDSIIGDLRQEITSGSTAVTLSPAPPGGPATLYIPSSTANMVPRRSGNLATVPNLIRRSIRSDPVPSPPAVKSSASTVNSTTDVSANGRFVSSTRWNSHYLILKKDTATNDSVPIDDFTNNATPDWVFVTDDPTKPGRSVITGPNNSVIGRYAYAIYDEGGLVDMNAAGYPSPTPANTADIPWNNWRSLSQYGRKGSLAFADLKGLGSFGLSDTGINNVVGWRNYASAQPGGSLSSNFSFSANSAKTYYNFILSDPTSIQLWNFFANSSLNYFTNYFLTADHTNSALATQPSLYNNQTDQSFTGRKELIRFASATTGGNFTMNALQHLGTLSREAMASVPQWSPASPNSTNPNFQTLLATAPIIRNDGTTANAGEYLLDRRFLLQRLNWLTYLGPSHARTIPTSAPSLTGCIPVSATCARDYDMWLLTRTTGLTFGLTSTFLAQGTDLSEAGQTATTANIYKYFGLVWDTTNQCWNYIGHPASPSVASPLVTTIASSGSITGSREPDFFELLQAGILSGSIADSVASYPELPITHQQSSILHILSIGANLIAQSRMDSYPVRIACSVGGTRMEAVGAPRLPYLNGLAACPVGVTVLSGGMNWLLVPNLWDPFRDSWDLTEANTSNSSNGSSSNGPLLTPGYLRPPVRITIGGSNGAPTIGGSGGNGGATLGVTSGVTNSGRVASASPVGTLITIPFSPLQLVTGNVTSGSPAVVVGRDGFLQAMRLGASDFTPAPGPFNPTTLGPSTPSWNTTNVRPSGDTATAPRSDNYVVFRISSSSTLPTANNPALILSTGFQMTMDYQSPNGTWYSYSFLQGNNAVNTWITANPNPLYIATSYSQYFQPTTPIYTAPTVCNSNSPTLWTGGVTPGLTALAQAPMFAKADPRSIRYNSQVGALTVSSGSAGIIGSIWPNAYATPPPMPGAVNPATYSQTTGDNAPAASNPYNEAPTPTPTPTPTPPTPTPSPTPTWGDAVRPVMMNRPFRSVGEMAYAFRDQPFRTLSFSWAPNSPNPDAGLLDLFTTTAYDPTPTPSPTPSASPAATSTPTPTPRGGVINLNSQQPGAIAGVLTSTIRHEDTPRAIVSGSPSPTPTTLASPDANPVAPSLASSTATSPILNRARLADLIANLPGTSGLGPGTPKTERESVARALGEMGQTRTWNLLIDVIAQSGRYPPNATSLTNGFVVEGEQRYWIHVAIDRFTGEVIGKQIEVVNE